MRVISRSLSLAALLVAPEALASFHFMQIEQAIGGVDSDVSQQAVQLRMRSGGQHEVSFSRLRVSDATGQNPVLLVDMGSNVGVSALGARILITSTAFAAAQGITPDFLMTNPIPLSYLAAGRLTFESDGGSVVWSLAWGGSAYTGSNGGAADNDANANYGPPFALALPSTTRQSLLFPGAATALSTSNVVDYGISTGAARVTNNAGASIYVGFPDRVFSGGFEQPVLP